MRRLVVGVICYALLVWQGGSALAQRSPQPVAPTIPVTDDYFGTHIVDPYRWMEARRDPRFVAWLKAENAHAEAVIATIPGIDALQRRIAARDATSDRISSLQPAGGLLFYLKRPAGAQTAKLYVRRSAGGAERMLVDPDRFAGAGTHGAVDYFSASQDGSKVAVSISKGGSENGVLRVIDVASGSMLPDIIDRVEQGRPSWLPNGSGFFYNRFADVPPGAPETERYFNSKAMLHRLGTEAVRDVALIGIGVAGSPPVSKIDYPYVVAFPNSRWAVALVVHGASPACDVLVAPLKDADRPGARWRRIAVVTDEVADAQPVGDRLFLLSYHGAPRYKLLEVNAVTGGMRSAKTVVPPTERVIQAFSVAKDAIYLQELDGGIGRLRRLDLMTNVITDERTAQGSVSGLVADPSAPGSYYALSSWLAPDRFYVDRREGPRPLGLGTAPSTDVSAYEVEEVRARSWDGTMVPLSIVHRRDIRLDGRNPIWLQAYGAYGAAVTPRFLATFLPFIEDGGVFAVAHVRGGGEFGEEWHVGGFQGTKPNTFKDLIACAEYLHLHGYGSPSTTAIQGGSAGGIAVGMAMTARPDLFRVVFDQVGDNNTLRAEHGTDGEGNALEYGSTSTREGFNALFAVDATQHVRSGVAYPAVFLTTGYNDPRVAPFQPGKMAARLQAATSSGRPILLRVDFDAGHGIGSTRDQRERELAEQLGFLYWQIGVPGYRKKG